MSGEAWGGDRLRGQREVCVLPRCTGKPVCPLCWAGKSQFKAPPCLLSPVGGPLPLGSTLTGLCDPEWPRDLLPLGEMRWGPGGGFQSLSDTNRNCRTQPGGGGWGRCPPGIQVGGAEGDGPGCGALQVYESLCTWRCVYLSCRDHGAPEPKAGLGPPAPPAGDSLELGRVAATARGRGP